MVHSPKTSSNALLELTFTEIEQRVATKPYLLIPIGGLEPVGANATLGLINEVTSFITKSIADRCDLLYAPLLSYSNTTPFRAFGGSIGVKRNIFESLIANMARDSEHWGIKKLYLINGSFENKDLLEKSIKRIDSIKKSTITLTQFSWQQEKEIRDFIAKNVQGAELGRTEYALLSMISYFKPFMLRSTKSMKKDSINPEIYKKWHKRGADPDRFRKLFPQCSTSKVTTPPDAQFGKLTINYIVDFYANRITDSITGKGI